MSISSNFTPTGPDPNQLAEIQQRISQLQFSVDNLQSSVRLAGIRDEVEDFDTKVKQLPLQIVELRSRKYIFEKQLEQQADNLAKFWIDLKPAILIQINTQTPQLESQLRLVQANMTRLVSVANNPVMAQSLAAQLQSDVSNLQGSVSGAESAIKGSYDQLSADIAAALAKVEKIKWVLTQMDEACFGFLPGEATVTAVKAEWWRDLKEDKNEPNGILYLTDQRLIFEQKEEIATKKILFIATEKQKVQQLQFEAPVALVENILPTKQGIFKNEDHVELHFKPGAQVMATHFHLNGQDCNEWTQLVNRVRTREIDADRVLAVDQVQVEKIKAAPTTCPACSGALTAPILRGQDTITCPYCGNIIRL